MTVCCLLSSQVTGHWGLAAFWLPSIVYWKYLHAVGTTSRVSKAIGFFWKAMYCTAMDLDRKKLSYRVSTNALSLPRQRHILTPTGKI